MSDEDLFNAIKKGYLSDVRELVKSGANVNCRDWGGEIPLHYAVERSKEIVEFLVTNGAEVNAMNDYGITPLHAAASGGNEDIVEYLIAHDAKINARDEYGTTPLHAAASNGRKEAVVSLIALGANISAKDKRGKSPIDETKNEEIKKILLNYINNGSPVELKDGSSTSKEQVEKLTAAPSTETPKSSNILKEHQHEQQQQAQALEEALKQGSKEWNRSKIMLVGEGRAGKTAVANAISGRPFTDTASTVGINQLSCDTKILTTAKTCEESYQWVESQTTTDGRQLEAALAEIMARKKRGKDSDITTKSAASSSDDHILQVLLKQQCRETDRKAKQELEEIERANEVATAVSKSKGHSIRAVETTDEKLVNPNKSDTEVAAIPAAISPPKSISSGEVDEALVLRELAKIENAQTGLKITLFDYGGQSVFDVIHHLFLTRNGVYLLVFNMEWLLPQSPVKEVALRCISKWLSSIALHTFDEEANCSSPIALVGTRLDKVTDAADHNKISFLLEKQFNRNLAWRNVLCNRHGKDENGDANQWFFPVDNKIGMKGLTMKLLMKQIEGAVDSATYTHKQVPLTWLRAMDLLGEDGKDCLSLDEVAKLGLKCDISEATLPSFLSFLHDAGHLMWHDEAGLRDVIILDPVSYLVTPATIVICNLNPTETETSHHIMDDHLECGRKHNSEWCMLKESGVLNTVLLPILWKKYQDKQRVLLSLMVKFGLLVRLRTTDKLVSGHEQFLVPSLLPTLSPSLDMERWTNTKTSTCFYVFTLATKLQSRNTLIRTDLQNECFLPNGLFERLIGMAISWAQDTAAGSAINLENFMLYKDVVILQFGRQRFRLTHLCDINCIRVDIEGNNPVPIHDRLLNLIVKSTEQCMKNLCCFSAVLYDSEQSDDKPQTNLLFSRQFQETQILIPLNHLQLATLNFSILTGRHGHFLHSAEELKRKYAAWLQLYEGRDSYDIFISYRWNDFDSAITQKLFDMLTIYDVGEPNRPVQVFLDIKRLKEGSNFISTLGTSIANTLVALPVISCDALERMLSHDPDKTDNLLLEWILILEFAAKKRIEKVFLVLFGKRTRSVDQQQIIQVEDFFSSGIADKLPHVVPKATLDQALALLRAEGVDASEEMTSYTVHTIVHKLLQYLGYKAPDGVIESVLVEHVAGKVVTVVQDNIKAHRTKVDSDVISKEPVASPVVGVRDFDTLSNEELCQLIETDYPPLVPIFREKNITGAILSGCEEYAELMEEEFGITSKPTARSLMKKINLWNEKGVMM